MGSQSVSLYYRHGDRYPGGRCDRDVLVLNEHKYGLAKALLLYVRGKKINFTRAQFITGQGFTMIGSQESSKILIQNPLPFFKL